MWESLGIARVNQRRFRAARSIAATPNPIAKARRYEAALADGERTQEQVAAMFRRPLPQLAPGVE
jgi:hypothetical protein